MKKFIYVLMWIQLGLSILATFFTQDIFTEAGLINLDVYTSSNTDWILFFVLYIAWRVTPELKQ